MYFLHSPQNSRISIRRPHTKSRRGCVRCKQKHVKCDEVRPTCGFCARYDVPCLVVPTRATGAESSRARSGTRKAPRGSPDTREETKSTSSDAAISPGSNANEPRSSLSLWEFELLHHWIINVADSFDVSPGFHRAWRDQAITAATKHDFFMHMILIISALHLATTNSPKFTERHREFILNGCSDAMSAFQRAAQNVTDDNCEELRSFPFIVAVYGLALAQFDRIEKSEETVLDETIHIMNLIKANYILAQTTDPIIRSRSVKRWVEEEDILVEGENSSGHSDLIQAVNNLQIYIDISGDDEDVRTLNTRAATKITEPATYTLKPNLRPFVWPNLVEDEFLGLLTARNPMALVILAHYAVVLDQARSQWWCANWGARIVSVVRSCLPEQFIPAIAYPLDTIRLI
ncbi:hypothetical protein RU639_011747 [Aspergillus parasiticus]